MSLKGVEEADTAVVRAGMVRRVRTKRGKR